MTLDPMESTSPAPSDPGIMPLLKPKGNLPLNYCQNLEELEESGIRLRTCGIHMSL